MCCQANMQKMKAAPDFEDEESPETSLDPPLQADDLSDLPDPGGSSFLKDHEDPEEQRYGSLETLFGIYLKGIPVDLLTREEELEQFQKLEEAHYSLFEKFCRFSLPYSSESRTEKKQEKASRDRIDYCREDPQHPGISFLRLACQEESFSDEIKEEYQKKGPKCLNHGRPPNNDLSLLLDKLLDSHARKLRKEITDKTYRSRTANIREQLYLHLLGLEGKIGQESQKGSSPEGKEQPGYLRQVFNLLTHPDIFPRQKLKESVADLKELIRLNLQLNQDRIYQVRALAALDNKSQGRESRRRKPGGSRELQKLCHLQEAQNYLASEYKSLSGPHHQVLKCEKELISKNQRLVVSRAKRKHSPCLATLDLVQFGNFGLMTAVERYYWRYGTRFSTYAVRWIDQAIGRAIADYGSQIRLPVHEIVFLAGYKNFRRKMVLQLGPKISPETIAREFARARLEKELGKEFVGEELEQKVAGQLEHRAWLYQRRIRRLTKATELVSLNLVIGQEEESTLQNLVADKTMPDPGRAESIKNLREVVCRLLSELRPREEKTLRMIFGLDDRTYTLEEIGNKFGVTRERARQIKIQALECLRKKITSRKINLGVFMEEPPASQEEVAGYYQ